MSQDDFKIFEQFKNFKEFEKKQDAFLLFQKEIERKKIEAKQNS